jgi:hypothetical protein
MDGGQDAPLFEQRLQEVTLGGEMIVDGGVGDAGNAGYVPNSGAGEAAFGEEAQGGVEDLVAGIPPAAWAPLRTSGSGSWS